MCVYVYRYTVDRQTERQIDFSFVFFIGSVNHFVLFSLLGSACVQTVLSHGVQVRMPESQ